MATKTFKIGLSNTDKQNMAQDVYERLLALTFPEYDTTTQYSVGDFVVYNDQLYKCIGATSGAWDSTKWQLATLNDLLTDIEDAVAFVNDKANVDGNYPTMTVGVADQLSPYDDKSGNDQDEPFSFQATGTGNGSQPDFSTGAIALMKEKRGNTVCVNQILDNGTFNDYIATTWGARNGTITAANHIATVTAQGGDGYAVGLIGVSYGVNDRGKIDGHKYLFYGDIWTMVDNAVFSVSWGGGVDKAYLTYPNPLPTNTWYHFQKIIIATATEATTPYYLNESYSEEGWEYKFRNVGIIDLTIMFGSNDNIPSDLLSHPENFFRYYQGSLAYNEGELVNANGRYIKCIGMNQFDGTNDVKAIPNATYYINGSATLTYKDREGNTIDSESKANETFTTPANCLSIGVSGSGDISINLYYEKSAGVPEQRCLTYEPYEVLTNNDTGNEVLRSAGSVHDIKKPDGTITRNIGVVDLGSLEWAYAGTNTFYVVYNGIKLLTANMVTSNGYTPIALWTPFSNSDKAIHMDDNGQLYIKDSGYTDATTFKTAMSGVYLYYELATPTTEQGTTFSENLVIDDFGSMDFSGTSGVPQGNLIFYPVDYKAFIDTLYNYTQGTPSNIALKSDVVSEQNARESVDTQLLNAVGGTLRQCLCVKETLDFDNTDFIDLGELTWTYSTLNNAPAFNAVASINNKQNTNCLCTKYKTQGGYDTTDKSITLVRGSVGHIWVYDTSYTDATTFKAAMKGVLLAYEKAEE